MTLQTPANTTSEEPKKLDRFHPDMPKIPGLGPAPSIVPPPIPSGSPGRTKTVAAAIAVLVGLGGLAALWVRHQGSKQLESPSSDTVAAPATEPAPDTLPSLPVPAISPFDGRIVVATSDELSTAWTSKKFVYVKPFTRDPVNAMVIRLPGGELWAFALQEPNGRCELDYVKNVHDLAGQYGYRAVHPMVVSPCDKTVYDPLKVGSLGGSILVRGDIVKGSGLRPPIAIDVVRDGKSIIADRIE